MEYRICHAPQIRLLLPSLIWLLYMHSIQNCMVSCKSEKASCLSAQKRWCFLTALDYIVLFLVFKMNDAFILHDYSAHSEDRIIYFLQYVNTLQKLIFLYNTLIIQSNWGTDQFQMLPGIHVMSFFPFLSILISRYFQKADQANFISMKKEQVKPKNNKYIVRDPPSEVLV